MKKFKPQETAILYLCATQDDGSENTALKNQENTLKIYCEKKNIKVIKTYYDTKLEGSRHLQTELCKQIFKRQLKIDWLLFTRAEVFSENISDTFNLHFILLKYGVTTKAISTL